MAHLFLLSTNDINSDLDKLKSTVRSQFTQSEQLIPANIDFAAELNNLMNDVNYSEKYSAIKLNIYKGGDLVLWNYPEIIDTISNNSDFYQIDQGQNFTTVRDLNLFNDKGLIHHELLVQAEVENQFIQSNKKNASHELVLNGVPVFLKHHKIVKHQWKSFLCIALLLITTFLFLLSFFLFSRRILNIGQNPLGVLASLGLLFLIRLALGQIDFYSFYPNEQIFNPIHSYSTFHPTVGLSFWNSCFLSLAAIIFTKHQLQKPKNKAFQILLYGSVYLASILILILFVHLSSALVLQSEIVLDNQQIISFDKHSLLEILGLVMLLIISFLLHYKIIETAKSWKLNGYERILGFGLAAGSSYAIYLQYIDYPSPWMFYMVLIAFYLIQDLFVDTQRKNLPWTIWWTLLYAGFMSALIFGLSFQKRIIERGDFLESLYQEDKDGVNHQIEKIKEEILESGIISKISNLPTPFKFERSDIKDFLMENMNDAQIKDLKKNFEVYIFDGNGNPYFNDDFSRENKIIKEINISKRISPDVFYSPFNQTYYLKYFTENTDNQGRKLRIYFSFDKSNDKEDIKFDTDYIVYRHGEILLRRQHYESSLSDFANFNGGDYFLDRHSILVREKGEGIKIISVERIANLLKPISIFSFCFLFIGLTILLLTILNSLIGFFPNSLNLQFTRVNSLRSKLQLLVIALVVLAFIFIGFASFYYFKNILESNKKEEFARELDKIQKDVYTLNRDALDDDGSLVILSNSIQELSEIHDVDISIYDANANLINSIVEDKKANLDFATVSIFKNNIGLSSVNQIKDDNTSFIALKTQVPIPYGFIEIQHRSSAQITEKLKDFISTILNLYVFLFLLAGAIAISVANSISYPLTVLSEKLKQTKLGRKNEVLNWNSNDEIGILIQEYNGMIEKLEESASLLAKNERDQAWREMAKQVAHEVKNPLTPMKLSVQSLNRAIKANPENAEQLINKVSTTLVEQIDALAEIANSFSNLAKMPIATNQKIKLNDIVVNVHDLFKEREDLDFQLILPLEELSVYADKNQLIRILNNLIKNAIQSIPPSRKGNIRLELSQKENNALLKITDNGSGIAEDKRDKIFTPNFTTKSTGTGLGLAMCASMIESLNGQIYFETEVDKGTEFFVEIPLIGVK